MEEALMAVSPEGNPQFGWLAGLSAADTPDQVAMLIIDMAHQLQGCEAADVVWGLADLSSGNMAPRATVHASDASWLATAAASEGAQWDVGGRRVAIRLCEQPEAALLVMRMPATQTDPALDLELSASLRLVGRHLQRALAWAELQHSHQQLARSEALQRALFAISDLAGSDRDMPDMLRGIHAIVSTLMYAENFYIALLDEQADTICFLYFIDTEDSHAPGHGRDLPMGEIEHTLTWHVIRDGRARMGSPVQLREQVDGPLSIIGTDSHDWLGVPMLRDGKPAGALVVQSYREGIHFTREDMALLEFVGTHILTALERKQTKEELERRVLLRTLELAEANRGLQLEIVERQRAERLQTALFRISQMATADIDQGEFYRRVHAVVGELLNAENFFIALLSDDRQRLTFPYSVDAVDAPPTDRRLGRGLSEYVLRRGTGLRVDNREIEALAANGEIAAGRSGAPALCWLGVPLIVGDQVIGLVAVQSYQAEGVYDAVDEELLTFVATQIAHSLARRRAAESLLHAYAQLEYRVEERTEALRNEISERERAQEQLRHEVMHDPLTGLPNRGYLRERIDRALMVIRQEVHRRCALLYLDVDRFKVINDSLGHLAGDAVLKEVARRLGRCVRHPDLVARLSGDEFAILLVQEVDTAEVALAVARRVLDVMREPMLIEGKELQPSVSIGVAIASEGEGYRVADELLRDADIALYRAKELGRKRVELFDKTLARSGVDVLALEGELCQALQLDGFEPYFQPITLLGNSSVAGYEALIRWNHPARGMLLPGEFLGVAAECGLMEAIDWRMFELSCASMVQIGRPDQFLTLNVSALHLRHADFDTRLLALLGSTGLPPEQVMIEVTEGALLDDPERVRETLERLRAAGVGAALDDFGTGYSSLSYLHSLPLRMLKIDRAFVHRLDKVGNANSNTVVSAILALARELNIRVIAEGIETAAQQQTLMNMGCELGQGFLLGRPASTSAWLAHRNA